MGFGPLHEGINIHFGEVFADHAVDEDVAVADFLEDEAIARPIQKCLIVPGNDLGTGKTDVNLSS
jgi:hypothetical protein